MKKTKKDYIKSWNNHVDKVRKNRKGLMGSKTRVHPDRRTKIKAKIDKQEIDDSI